MYFSYGRFQSESTQRPVEELQQRFYSVVSKLQTGKSGDGGQGASNELTAPGLNVFNLQYEQHRRRQVN
jgi:hypothetical protein